MSKDPLVVPKTIILLRYILIVLTGDPECVCQRLGFKLFSSKIGRLASRSVYHLNSEVPLESSSTALLLTFDVS